MKIHMFNIGDCQKCTLAMTSFLSADIINKPHLKLTDNPKNCDVLLISGCLSKSQLKPLMDFWKQVPAHNKVISLGDCGTKNQDLFGFDEKTSLKNQAIEIEDLAQILPVDIVITGCPPGVEEIFETFKQIS